MLRLTANTINPQISFASIKTAKSETENGAISHSTTGDPRLDFFCKVTRDTPENYLQFLLQASWEKDPLDTLKIVFHLRDCRGGKGEREQFYRALRWLMHNHQEELSANLEHVPFYGRFKDFLVFLDTPLEGKMIELFVAQLKADKFLLDGPLEDRNKISLAAKYAPTEGQSHDIKHKAVKKFAASLQASKKSYRKEWLVPLRNHINILEHHMTDQDQDWASIEFSKVPSVALKKYKKAFARRQEARYSSWLESVKKGEAKINVGRLMPHEIVGAYIKSGTQVTGALDQTVEAQWTAFVEQTRKTTKFGNALAIVDVSGSMAGGPKEKVAPVLVSTALGLLVASLTKGIFHDKFITFAESPELVHVKGDTLHRKLSNMTQSNWGTNTNFQKALTLVLEAAKLYSVKPEDMPSTLFVFSDMQFDRAFPDNATTNRAALTQKYAKFGYKVPRIVFWNLRGNTLDFPTTQDDGNTCILSGFSSDLLKLIVDGEEISPLAMMRKALDDPRYQRITLA